MEIKFPVNKASKAISISWENTVEGLLATLAPCPAKKMCEVCSDLEEADDLKLKPSIAKFTVLSMTHQ